MATIEVEIEINATVDKVWDIVSDIDNEPKFWKGTKEVKNLSKDGNIVNREIIIAVSYTHLTLPTICSV